MTPARWRPALRMARRDLRLHKGRSLLTSVLVAVPVLVAVVVALFAHNTDWRGEAQARELMGAADASVQVSRFAAVDVTYNQYGDVMTRPAEFTESAAGKRVALTRDRSSVDVAALLPAGSRLVSAPLSRWAKLSTGGTIEVVHADADDPLLVGLTEIGSGRAPEARDEGAVPPPMAEALGFLDASGALREDATVTMADGETVRIVGLTRPTRYSDARSTTLVVPFDSVIGEAQPRSLLVDLPDLPAPTRPELRELSRDLAAAGVALLPRDVLLTPAKWAPRADTPIEVNVAALALGGLALLVGLVEVVLVVGSAFAISARRRVRELGLLAASGGAPVDVRRVLLAQGLVLGVLASLVGAALGVGAFHLLVPGYEALTVTRVWTRDVELVTVGALALLGSFTGLAAAFVPAWSISKLTPVSALSGRFPVRPGESVAHRPAFVLAGLGLLVLALGGWWISVAFTPPTPEPVYWQPSPVPVLVAGLGLLMLIAGVVWSAPYAVRRVGTLGRVLPLSGRFAFRDAMRHRFRSGAAAVTLAITVAGAVLTGFATTSVAAVQREDGWMPPHTISLYGIPSADRQPELHSAFRSVLDRTFGDYRLLTASSVAAPSAGGGVGGLHVTGRQPHLYVEVVNEQTLHELVAEESLDEALAAFRDGGVVLTRGKDRAEATLGMLPRRKHPELSWTVSAARVSTATPVGEFASAWISPETAADLDLVLRDTHAMVRLDRPVTERDRAALAVAGFSGSTPDIVLAQMRWIGWGATGAAGLLTLLVAGMAVALAAAESRSDAATFAAVGAGPRRRRGLGAMHGLFLGLVGTALGLAIAVPAGLSLTQIDGLAGVLVPWSTLLGTLLVAPLFAALAGWLVTPTRLSLVRRTA